MMVDPGYKLKKDFERISRRCALGVLYTVLAVGALTAPMGIGLAAGLICRMFVSGWQLAWTLP